MKRISLVLALLLLLVVSPARAAIVPHLAEIGMDQVWADPTFAHLTGAGQSIAVLDTGIDTEHVLFGSRILDGANFVTPLAPLATGSEPYRDGHGHGTHVASIAAGSNAFTRTNGDQIGGVAPGAGLVPVRVLDNDGNGSFDDIRDALYWVRDNASTHNIRTVNLSLGTQSTFIDSESLSDEAIAQDVAAVVDELRAMGIAVVAASGNSGQGDGLSFPAVLDNIISVGASDGNAVADFTNRSNDLDLLAPGVDVWGAYAALDEDDPHNLIAMGSGTSAATPMVAGAFLLMHQLYVERVGLEPTTDELLGILQSTGTLISEDDQSWQKLNVYAALVEIDGYAFVPEPGTAMAFVSAGMLLLLRRRATPQR
ncbi:MAG: S8 family serine peptidase [Phycisphaeraceae bacterium]